MIKRVSCSLALLLLILFFHSQGLAQSPPIFSNKYTRTIGRPNTYQDVFQACSTTATYKLVVENGEGGKDRLSSASVSLNGQEVVRENEFNQRIDKIEKTVTLQSENTLDVKLASGPGGLIKASIYCISGCLDVKITSPSDNSTVNRSKTLVQGNLSNVYGETGITLQSSGATGQASVLAEAQGNSFAGIAPLQQGQNTITATATDACGYQAHDTITISTESVQEQIRLSANPQSGIPDATGTFGTTIEADAYLPNPIASYSWDTDGDGTAEQSGKDLSKITATYQAPGLYFPRVTITDSQNNTYTENTIINVLSKEQMDALLKGKWEGMKGGLSDADIEKAVGFFEEGSQDTYRNQFIALKSILPMIANDMGQINLVKIEGNRAEYEIVTSRNGATYSFYLLFIRDKDGLWKTKVF
jgi:hypothetical protein